MMRAPCGGRANGDGCSWGLERRWGDMEEMEFGAGTWGGTKRGSSCADYIVSS